MSDLLYSTRLRWSGTAGIAKLHGYVVQLTQPPDLGAGAVHAVDYVPEVQITELQPRACEPRRDMTPAECSAADALLHALVRRALVP